MQKRTGVAQAPSGKAIPHASVTVRTSTGAQATLYSDNGVTPLANPVTANATGEYTYYAANGRYSETIAATGRETETDSDSVLLFDPADVGAVSIKDYGTSADWAAALIAAGAAVSGPVTVPSSVATISPSAAQVAGVLEMLDRIRVDGDLAISLPSGHHALTAQVVINSPDAQRISIVGASVLSTTAASQVSVSGSAKAYSVIVGVASSAGAVVGDYALVFQDVTGTGDYQAHAGCWKITAVDSGGANRLTLLNTHHGAAFPTNTLTGGTVKILKTVLTFTGCDGFRFEGGQPLGRLDQVAIVGDYVLSTASGTTGAHGIVMAAPVITGGASSNALHNMAGGAAVGPWVGISGWGEQGVAVSGRCVLVANFVASCSNRKRGWYSEGGHIRAKFSIGSGNGEDGYIADIAGALQANNSIACGNGLNGYWSTNGSMLAAATSVAQGNLSNGFEARGLTRLNGDASTAKGNTSAGFAVSDGGMLDADSATADANAVGFDAAVNATIDANNASATGNTSFGARATYNAVVNVSGSGTWSGNAANYSATDALVIQASGGNFPSAQEGGTRTIYNAAKDHNATLTVSSIGDTTLQIDGSTRWVTKTGAGTKFAGSAPTTSAGEIGIGSGTASTVGAAGGASALPATPLGYLVWTVAGTSIKVPYYNV